MKLLRSAARVARPRTPRALPALGRVICFLCEHASSIPLRLPPGRPSWVECEHCGLDNEIPAGTPLSPAIRGLVPTRFF